MKPGPPDAISIVVMMVWLEAGMDSFHGVTPANPKEAPALHRRKVGIGLSNRIGRNSPTSDIQREVCIVRCFSGQGLKQRQNQSVMLLTTITTSA